jgi:hypothetical protein
LKQEAAVPVSSDSSAKPAPNIPAADCRAGRRRQATSPWPPQPRRLLPFRLPKTRSGGATRLSPPLAPAQTVQPGQSASAAPVTDKAA